MEMTGAALVDFLIAVICLCCIVGMIFYAIPYMSKDPTFQHIAKLAVGVVALLAFLVAVKGVLFGGGGAMAVTPVNLIEFAIGLIVIMVVVFIINWVIGYFGVPFSEPAQFVIGATALIALLIIAERALFGGGIGLSSFHLKQGAIERHHVAGIPHQPFVYSEYRG
jgi:hypothetical protein